MEKMKMHTPNLTDENILKIKELFPSVVTEARDEDGNLKLAVDFDQLRQELSDHIVEGPQERFTFNWPGKKQALMAANAPIAKTLRPIEKESVNFDVTKNLFIEGDNLEALKLLQETYLGKVKMIYIDPPYNTGNDFIYDDDFVDDFDGYMLDSNQIDEDGNRLLANTENNGRFHSDWLSMMYSRLKLARNLLREDGVIFISISDDEQANLKKLCDDIFGPGNFLGCACRVSKKANNKGDFWSPNFDYILTYAKSKADCEVFLGGINTAAYDQSDVDGPRAGEKYQLVRLYMSSLDSRPNQRYFIEAPDGTLLIPPGNVFPANKADGAHVVPESNDDKVWRWSKDSYVSKRDEIVVKEVRSSNLVDENGQPVKWNVYTKTYLNDVIAKSSAKPNSLVEDHINQKSSHELNSLEIPFSFAKPSSLIEFLCEICRVKNDDLVMDFFAGSGTTGHAVMKFNENNNQSARYIVVQLPEELDFDNKSQKAGYSFCKKMGFPTNISSITKERLRRSGKTIKASHVDTGFRVLKVDTSNMADVFYRPDEIKQGDLLASVSNIKEGRDNAEDLLFQVLLDWGVDLTLPIERKSIQGKDVYFVDQNALVACFEIGVTEELVKEIASHSPLRVVFKDNGFVSDAVKINVDQVFRQLSPSTEVKSI
ncbi:site-specific DNA-methyltransferase [Kordiimonas lacus]|uniref:site-specific DNA-methyltransferase (adenine-specific) n=1 Tax=Kordiimonas lacus TaxID=637679 RepID=A0A1G7BK31_9PROT|nr:site-specific DNA-methyltransferase [Kordiimonas lacus]SDE27297.1 adenine-specific DNA-methyltransferase [Kordiimonas lacus]